MELRFNADLYSGFAVDAAVKVYEEYAEFELEKQDDAFVVRLKAGGEFTEEQVADELFNYVLGATVEERGQAAEGSAES